MLPEKRARGEEEEKRKEEKRRDEKCDISGGQVNKR